MRLFSSTVIVTVCFCKKPRYKYEEDVEEGGDRWSKPHVATLSLYSLFELRSSLMAGTVILDKEATSLDEISGEKAGMLLNIYMSLFSPHTTSEERYNVVVVLTSCTWVLRLYVGKKTDFVGDFCTTLLEENLVIRFWSQSVK